MTSFFSFFEEEMKSVKKGENHYQSGHVESFVSSSGVMRGLVHTSMKKKVYQVTIYLDGNNDIKSAECECPRGKFKCSHAAALFVHGIHNLGRTDVECQWKKRKAACTVNSAADMFPKPNKYAPITRQTTSEDRQSLFDDLASYGRFTGLYWIMSPESAPVRTPIPTVEEILFSEGFLAEQYNGKQRQYFMDNVRVNDEKILQVSKLQ